MATATVCSALNQALYELFARRGGVPVWRLFADNPTRNRVPVYVTINRVLKSRTLGDHYAEIRRQAGCHLAAAVLFFGGPRFEELARNGWVDVLMPDIKHVGGLGPLLDVCSKTAGYGVEVSPHNAVGPVAT